MSFLLLRNGLAVAAGKAALTLSRRFGHGGSSLPGLVARRIQPAILRQLSGGLRHGTVIITGTNGKTTTTRFLSTILEDAGYRLVQNRSGANLIDGLTAAFVEATSGGKVNADLALMEVDEATVPQAVRELRPLGVVVTNFFRDQLDRYGELDTTAALVGRGLADMRRWGFVALNADDPLVAYLGRSVGDGVVLYGLEDRGWARPTMEQTREQRHCLLCGRELEYTGFYYAHLGRYACPAGDFTRPQPGVRGGAVRLEGTNGSSFTVTVPGEGEARVTLGLPGLYNVYNALAALCAALRLGVSLPSAARSLARTEASFGRMERINVNQRDVLLALVKNPTGFNQVLRTLLVENQASLTCGPSLLIAINDRYADGTDVSWLWDVDFEILAHTAYTAPGIVVSGLRAYDMALRLKYAGVKPDRVRVVPSLEQALDETLAGVGEGETVFAMPTYTAMLDLRDIISRRGYAPQFWEAGER